MKITSGSKFKNHIGKPRKIKQMNLWHATIYYFGEKLIEFKIILVWKNYVGIVCERSKCDKRMVSKKNKIL